MIDIVYTGDIRSTPEVSKQNHQMLFDEISKVSKYQIHDFTSPKGERNLHLVHLIEAVKMNTGLKIS